jgi:hypothetical protein
MCTDPETPSEPIQLLLISAHITPAAQLVRQLGIAHLFSAVQNILDWHFLR